MCPAKCDRRLAFVGYCLYYDIYQTVAVSFLIFSGIW